MAHKQQEEEAKKKKDKEDVLKQAEAEAAAIVAAQEKESEREMDKPDGNLNRNLHTIFNGIATKPEVLEELGKPKQEPEECSPAKKRGRSSKSSTKHSNANKVSPPKATATSTTKKITFEDTYVYPHKRVILDLAILLKSEKAFEEFTKALMAFIENAQMVDPKFFINTLNPKSKEKSITTKGKIIPQYDQVRDPHKDLRQRQLFQQTKSMGQGGTKQQGQEQPKV
jgi:hypothetical protein